MATIISFLNANSIDKAVLKYEVLQHLMLGLTELKHINVDADVEIINTLHQLVLKANSIYVPGGNVVVNQL